MSERKKVTVQKVTNISFEVVTKDCPRCGGKHEGLPLYDIQGEPILGKYNFWSICPTMQSPILIVGNDMKEKMEKDGFQSHSEGE